MSLKLRSRTCVAQRCAHSRLNLFKVPRRSSSLRMETDTKWERNAMWLLDQSLLPRASYIILNDNSMFKPSYITRFRIDTICAVGAPVIRRNSQGIDAAVEKFLGGLPSERIGNKSLLYFPFNFRDIIYLERDLYLTARDRQSFRDRSTSVFCLSTSQSRTSFASAVPKLCNEKEGQQLYFRCLSVHTITRGTSNCYWRPNQQRFQPMDPLDRRPTSTIIDISSSTARAGIRAHLCI